MKKLFLSILIIILYINSNAQSPLRINKYLIDSLDGSYWHIYHDSTHTGQWGVLGSGGGSSSGLFARTDDRNNSGSNMYFSAADWDFTLDSAYTVKLTYGNSHYYFTGAEHSTESYFQSNNNLFNTTYSQNADNTSAHIDFGTVGGSGNQYVNLQTTSGSQSFQAGNYINTGGFWVDQKMEMNNNHSNGGTYWIVHREKWTGSENFVSGRIYLDSLGVRLQTSKATLPLDANYKGLLVDSSSNVRLENYPSTRNDGTTTKALYVDADGDVLYGTISSAAGTVTNVASGFGLSGGPITTTGTLLVDSASIATRARVQKGIDSLGALIGGGGTTWNGITDPTGDQALTFGAGESSTWTDNNTTEDLFTVNNSTSVTSSLFSLNRTSTAINTGNNIMELVSSGANGNINQTAKGLVISVTNTNGTSGTNIGLDVTASGATTANYAALFSGRVGMGQTLPQTLLHVGPGATATAFGTAAQLTVSNGGSASYINILGPSSVEMFLGAEAGGGLFGTISNNDVLIRTNNTLRVTVSSAGVVTIANLAGTGSRNVLADASGVLSAPVSDRSVKRNIQGLDYGLDAIMKLNPVSFEYKDGWKNYGEGEQIGFIAQDIQKVLPNSVFTTPSTGKMGYNEIDLVPVLVKAVQEQQEEIESLKREIKRIKRK